MIKNVYGCVRSLMANNRPVGHFQDSFTAVCYNVTVRQMMYQERIGSVHCCIGSFNIFNQSYNILYYFVLHRKTNAIGSTREHYVLLCFTMEHEISNQIRTIILHSRDPVQLHRDVY